jgi:hypothetical protein
VNLLLLLTLIPTALWTTMGHERSVLVLEELECSTESYVEIQGNDAFLLAAAPDKGSGSS